MKVRYILAVITLSMVLLAVEGYYVYQFYADPPAAPAATVVEAAPPQTQPVSPTLVRERAWTALLKAADWQMVYTSGNDDNGIPTNVVQTGSTYIFNGSTSHVTFAHDESLNPAVNDITLTASIRVADEPMDDDSYDVVRKGLFHTAGGYYKMEILRTSDPTVGKLHCLFKGTGGIVNIVAPTDIVDGHWHTLECIKTSNSVVATMDGKSYMKMGSAGSISNSEEVLVGARTTNPFDDMFAGAIDFVGIDIA